MLTVFAFAAPFAARAFAEETLLATWLLNNAPVTSSVPIETRSPTSFEDLETIGGRAAVLCTSTWEGSVGANGQGETAEILNAANVSVGTLGSLALLGTGVASGEGSECKAETACAEGTPSSPIELWPLGLPWHTLLYYKTGGEFFNSMTGTEIGYELLCLVLGFNIEDKCVSSTENKARIEVLNFPEDAEIPSEDETEPKAICTQSGNKISGVQITEESIPILLLSAGLLSVYSESSGHEGTVESTEVSAQLSGEGKVGNMLTVLEGSKVMGHATLSGENTGTATGKARYKVYSDSKCKTLVTEAGGGVLISGLVPASYEEKLKGGASYYWQVHYSGDSKHTESFSFCGADISTIKAKTSLSTKLSGESKEGEELTVLEGSKVRDNATLTGTASSSASGNAVYSIYSDSQCTTFVKGAGEVFVISGSVPSSNEEELEGGKTYYWQVHYIGDSRHQESTSPCKEVLKVEKGQSFLNYGAGWEGKAAYRLISE